MKRKIDIMDTLPQTEEVNHAIDKDAFELLKANGYDNTDVKLLKKKLKSNGDSLRYSGAIDKEKGKILIWFNLYHGKELVARSKGCQFVLGGDSDGVEEEDRSSNED